MAAHVGKTRYKLGGVEREFGLLSVEDLVELTAMCPNPSGELINIADLDRFTRHPAGCAAFLVIAAKKVNPMLTDKDVSAWGSIWTRSLAAKHVFDLSMLAGEENLIPKATGAEAPPSATTGSTPSLSPNDAPASATPGS